MTKEIPRWFTFIARAEELERLERLAEEAEAGEEDVSVEDGFFREEVERGIQEAKDAIENEDKFDGQTRQNPRYN